MKGYRDLLFLLIYRKFVTLTIYRVSNRICGNLHKLNEVEGVPDFIQYSTFIRS